MKQYSIQYDWNNRMKWSCLVLGAFLLNANQQRFLTSQVPNSLALWTTGFWNHFTYFIYLSIYLWFSFAGRETEFCLSELYMFITGVKSIPPLGMDREITVEFKHGCRPHCTCRPTASTCSLTLTLPVHITSMEKAEEQLCSAIKEGRGFGFV